MLIEPPSCRAPLSPDSWAPVASLLRTAPELAAELVSPDFPRDLQTLTDAEYRVLRHLKIGMSNKEIATAVGRSEATVKNQIASMLHKLQVPTRARLIAQLWCAERHLGPDSDHAPLANETHSTPPPANRRRGSAADWRGLAFVAAS